MRRRLPRERWYAIRWAVLERDEFTCRYCGQYAPNVRLEVDHITPVSENGSDDIENLVTSCWACNQGKQAYRAIASRLPCATEPSNTNRVTIFEPVKPRLESLLQDSPNGLTVDEAMIALGASYRAIRLAIRSLTEQRRLTATKLPGRGGTLRYRLNGDVAVRGPKSPPPDGGR